MGRKPNLFRSISLSIAQTLSIEGFSVIDIVWLI